MVNKRWTREELILAIKLYCELPFGKMHRGNPEVVQLAGLVGRTPSSIAYKLVNFASLDPSLKRRGIKGMGNTSKLDKEIWNEFYKDWGALAFAGAELSAKMQEKPVERLYGIREEELPREGKERERIVKARVNQSFFRTMVMASYDYTCCITGRTHGLSMRF